MTNTTLPTSHGRGCGTRSAGSVYLCLGIGIGGTLQVEDLILDPVKIWPGKWQRGFKILPNRNGWNDVAIFVGEQFYLSPWDFIEETRHFGISRKVPPTFPFEQLTPGKSQMIFIHSKGHPRFEYSVEGDVELPLKGCKFFQDDFKLWTHTQPGYHPKVETQTKCTFAHQHLAGRIHNANYGDYREFTIEMPSFSYSGFYPLVKFEKGYEEMTWDIAAFMAAPISHIEMPKRLNTKAAERANKAGYEAIVTEF